MRNLLILSFVCLFGLLNLHGQTPIPVQFPEKFIAPSGYQPDGACNAGTFTFANFMGQSNDFAGYPTTPIFLCKGDTYDVVHDGNFSFMDPDASSAPGIGYVFYTCPPTATGPNWFAIQTDPCTLNNPPAMNGVWAAKGTPNGDLTLNNSGALNTFFNAGKPIQLYFAPITLDDFGNTGPDAATSCVSANAPDAFSVVYLNGIDHAGLTTNVDNQPCVGRFQVKGGWPEFDLSKRYTSIDISLQSDPSVKAIIFTPAQAWAHSAIIKFSVPQAGTYVVTISDGKSCSDSFTVDMAGCDPTQNVILDIAKVNTPTGQNVCVPITAQNAQNLVGAGFNLTWNPAIISYTGVQNVNPLLVNFNPGNHLNPTLSSSGFLGILYDPNILFSIPNGQVLFDVCFDPLGAIGQCATISAANQPTQTGFDSGTGVTLGLTINAGQVCIGQVPVSVLVTPHDTCGAPGSITIKASGGIPPYDLTIKDNMTGASTLGSIGTSGSTFTAINLAGGMYTIYVVDQGQTIDTIKNVKLKIQTLGAGLTFIEPSCNGKCDGSIVNGVTLDGSPVASPGSEYKYTWSFNNQMTKDLMGLCAGAYSVTIVNTLLGCSATAGGTLSQDLLLDASTISTVDASCTGVANGSLLLSMSGGKPDAAGAYDFMWSYSPDGAVAPVPDPAFNFHGANQNLTPIPPGFYTVKVTDTKGCTYTNTIELAASKALTLNKTAFTQPKCSSGFDGSLTISLQTSPAQANSASWDYMPQPPTANAVPGPLNYQLTGLPAGTYKITATDQDGCIVVDTFQLGEPTPIALLLGTKTNPTCSQPNSGGILLNLPTGGTPLYTYKWSFNNVATQNLSNVPAGSYTVTVTDKNNCTATATETLVLPPSPTIQSIDSVLVKCGSDGCLKVNATGTLTYSWMNLTSGSVVGITPQVCNLNGGNYKVCIKDANQCETCDTVALGGKLPLTFADTNFISPKCSGQNTGTISVVMGGGTTPYNFQWSNSGSGQVNTPLLAGTYTVTVRDANSCTKTGTFTLTDGPSISHQFVVNSIKPAKCFGQCDGAANVSAIYAGTPPKPGNFFFRWDDQPTADDSTRTDLCPGINTVTISDANGCSIVDSVEIQSPAPVEASPTSTATPVKCFGEANGSATVFGNGGNGAPFTYDWGAGGQNASVNNLAAGNYTVTIFDAQGCTGTWMANITEPLPVVVDTLSLEEITCNGGGTGEITVLATGGNPGPFSYLWTDGQDTVGTDPQLLNLPAGRYFVTATDAKGCTGELGPIILNNPEPVIGRFKTWLPLKCNGDQTTFSIDTIYGGVGGPYQYSIDYGVTLDPTFPISIGGGKHVIQYLDRQNCIATDSITVFEPDAITVNFDSLYVTIELGDSTELRPIIFGAVVDSFIWVPTLGLTNFTTLRPTANTYESTTYTLTVWDAKGCSGEGQIRVEVDPNRNVYLPNVFHAGSTSGLNDRFTPLVGAGVKAVNFMRIYDRWGEQLYERNSFFPNNYDFSEGWDGTSRGDKCQPGVYVYICEVEFLDGRILLYRGDVTLIR